MKLDLSRIEYWAKRKVTIKYSFQKMCEGLMFFVITAGFELFRKGYFGEIPEKNGDPKTTHGCIAVRIGKGRRFIITGRKIHMGKLANKDFVWVKGVNWETGRVTYGSNERCFPDETWLVDAIFKKFPNIGALIFTNRPMPEIAARATVGDPPLDREQYEKVFDMIRSGAKIIVFEGRGAMFLGIGIFQTANQALNR